MGDFGGEEGWDWEGKTEVACVAVKAEEEGSRGVKPKENWEGWDEAAVGCVGSVGAKDAAARPCNPLGPAFAALAPLTTPAELLAAFRAMRASSASSSSGGRGALVVLGVGPAVDDATELSLADLPEGGGGFLRFGTKRWPDLSARGERVSGLVRSCRRLYALIRPAVDIVGGLRERERRSRVVDR